MVPDVHEVQWNGSRHERDARAQAVVAPAEHGTTTSSPSLADATNDDDASAMDANAGS